MLDVVDNSVQAQSWYLPTDLRRTKRHRRYADKYLARHDECSWSQTQKRRWIVVGIENVNSFPGVRVVRAGGVNERHRAERRSEKVALCHIPRLLRPIQL